MESSDQRFENVKAHIEGRGSLPFSQREKSPVLWQLDQLRQEHEKLTTIAEAAQNLAEIPDGDENFEALATLRAALADWEAWKSA